MGTISVNPLHRRTMTRPTTQVELLILGAGWTSGFLIPLLESSGVSFAATSRDGREGTIPFNLDPSTKSVEQYKSLPDATTVLITFPVIENVKALVDGYNRTRSGTGRGVSVNWIQLGSTGSFTQVRPFCLAPLATVFLQGRVYLNRRQVGWIGTRILSLFPEAFKKQNYSSARLPLSCILLGFGEERGTRFIGFRGSHQTRTLWLRRLVLRSVVKFYLILIPEFHCRAPFTWSTGKMWPGRSLRHTGTSTSWQGNGGVLQTCGCTIGGSLFPHGLRRHRTASVTLRITLGFG